MFGFLVLMGALPGWTLSHESELRISGFLGLLCHHPFCTFVFSSLSLFLSLVLFCFGPPPVPGQETASSLIPALSVCCYTSRRIQFILHPLTWYLDFKCTYLTNTDWTCVSWRMPFYALVTQAWIWEGVDAWDTDKSNSTEDADRVVRSMSPSVKWVPLLALRKFREQEAIWRHVSLL